MSTPDPVRAAAYLATRERLDAKKRTIKVKCVAPNRQCGKRCIPPDWKCRIKGEGTDAHSRVVSGDPLAGAASIARGRDRLFKGLRTGNVSEIQGGRASIARGIVKAVPGQNLQQKQELRKRVEGVLLPVATGLFAMWAVRQGHEGAKVLFPVYARGPARDIENAASTAVGFIFDRIPVYGPRRQAQRRFAAVQAQVLGRAARISVIGDPTVSTNNNNAFIGVSRQRVAGVTTAIRDSLNIRNENGTVQSTYSQFRSDILGNVLGATTKGKSVYAEPTTVNFMARQFGISTNTLGSPDSTARKNSLISAVSRQLNEAAESMRTDMRVRGLDVSNPDAVRTYINIAETAARRRLTGLSVDQQDQALSRFRDLTTELIPTQRSTRTIAQRLFTETEDSFNTFFRDAAQQVREDTSPSLRVLQAGGPSPVRSALIGVAEQVKNRVGISAPIAGANHAELVLQRVYHENAVTGGYNARRRNTTWIATDSDIKYAAQDLGWDNQGGTTSAYAFLQRTGQFPNLAPPAANAGGQARSFGRAQQARSGRRPQTRAQRIASLMRQRRPDGTPVYATREAAEAAARRVEERNQMDARIDAYLLVRNDFTRTTDRLGKPCGKSFIPKQAKCSKPTTARYADKPQPEQGEGLASKVGKVALVAGAVAGTALAAKKGRDLYVNRRNVKSYTNFAPEAMNAAITRLSQADVRKGLAKVPKQFRPQAEQLLGKAKAAMAYISADAQGYNLRSVNTKSNFSVWSNDDRSRVMTVGSVGDTLVTFSADRSSTVDLRTENGRGVGVYDMQFNSDLGFQQKKGLDRQSQLGIAKMVKTMNTDVVANMPKNAVLRNIPYGDDGLGAKRRGIYEKAGYKSLPGIRGNAMFATLDNGKVAPIPPEYESFYANLIKGDNYDTALKKYNQRGRRDSAEIELPFRVVVYTATKELLGLAKR